MLLELEIENIRFMFKDIGREFSATIEAVVESEKGLEDPDTCEKKIREAIENKPMIPEAALRLADDVFSKCKGVDKVVSITLIIYIDRKRRLVYKLI